MVNPDTACLLLADLVVVLHFLFVLFVILGGLLVLKWRRLAWLHLPAVLWGIYIELSGARCPLTPLEIWFRQQAGADAYSGGFISHYLVPLIYPPGLTVEIQQWLAMIILIGNLLIYGFIVGKGLVTRDE